MSKFEITISLSRNLNRDDEKAVLYLMSQWLVYDARFNHKRSSGEITLFHTAGAKSDLVRELAELFPGENMTGM
jgi:hypothetical protein